MFEKSDWTKYLINIRKDVRRNICFDFFFSSFNIYILIVTRLFNIPYRKLSLNCKQNLKIRKEIVLIKRLFNKVLPRHGVKVGPGPWDPGPREPPSKFKSVTRDPPKV